MIAIILAGVIIYALMFGFVLEVLDTHAASDDMIYLGSILAPLAFFVIIGAYIAERITRRPH